MTRTGDLHVNCVVCSFIIYSHTIISGLQVAPEYKPHPLFWPKIWQKFTDKSHLTISRTLFCYLSPVWWIKPRWSRYHYCHLGARAACLARDFSQEFSRALPVRAVDGRHVLQCSWLPFEWDTTHTQTERQRERLRAGEGWPHDCRDSQWLWSTVGELIMIKCWSRHAAACSV